MRRLRFMPPTVFHYQANQVHDMSKFGPICRQRFPIDLSLIESLDEMKEFKQSNNFKLSSTSTSTLNRKEQLKNLEFKLLNSSVFLKLMRSMKQLMPKENFVYLLPKIIGLVSSEQSEDCLNLNVYSPRQGKWIQISLYLFPSYFIFLFVYSFH